MSAGEYVEDAADWAKALVLADQQCAGDYGNAMRRVARRVGVRFSVVWNLHYRLPKVISADDFERLGASFADDQRKRYAEERSITAPRTALGRLLVRAADFMGGEDIGPVK